MVLREPFDVVGQRPAAGGGEDADLPHRPAEHAAVSMGTPDDLARARQHRAAGCPEALGEGDRDEVEGRREGGRVDPQRRRGVEQARSVEVGASTPGVGLGHQPGTFLDTDDHATGAVVGVLEDQQGGRREDDVAGRLPGGIELGRCDASTAADGAELDARVGGAGARLVPHDVRLGRDEHVIAGAGQGSQRGLVGHRAAGHEQGCFLAQQCRHLGLQPVDGRILTELVVAHGGFGHRPSHLGHGQGDGVGAQVDGGHAIVSSRFDADGGGLELGRARLGVGGVDGQQVGGHVILEVEGHEGQPGPQRGIGAHADLDLSAPRHDADTLTFGEAQPRHVLGRHVEALAAPQRRGVAGRLDAGVVGVEATPGGQADGVVLAEAVDGRVVLDRHEGHPIAGHGSSHSRECRNSSPGWVSS